MGLPNAGSSGAALWGRDHWVETQWLSPWRLLLNRNYLTDLIHLIQLRCRSIPAIVQDEDVWLGESLAHSVKEILLLRKTRSATSAHDLCIQSSVVSVLNTARILMSTVRQLSCKIPKPNTVFQQNRPNKERQKLSMHQTERNRR